MTVPFVLLKALYVYIYLTLPITRYGYMLKPQSDIVYIKDMIKYFLGFRNSKELNGAIIGSFWVRPSIKGIFQNQVEV